MSFAYIEDLQLAWESVELKNLSILENCYLYMYLYAYIHVYLTVHMHILAEISCENAFFFFFFTSVLFGE